MLTSKKVFSGFLYTFLLTATTLSALTLAEVPRPIGVPLAKATLYRPNGDNSWKCLDESKTLKFTQINDDYCDCPDGSDEPGTSACPNGIFHCINQGHRSQDLPSSRVNDGICDCCDGSDEYHPTAGRCSNSCDELGRAEREQRKSQAEMLKKGAAKRSEMVARGQQLKAERENRRRELEQRRQEQEALKKEKEEIKKQAESLESEAIAYFKELHKEAEAQQQKEDDNLHQQLPNEAADKFMHYDTNKDGFVEIIELQVDINLDKDRNGAVSVEEAKYFLDERDRVDLDSFITLSWPRIKPMLMMAQGIFKPPQLPNEEEEHEGENDREEKTGGNAEIDDMITEYNERGEEIHRPQTYPEDGAEEEEEEAYEDDEADVGEGTVQDTHNAPTPEYDEETQRIINLANEARNSFAEVERTIREIDQEIRDIDDQNSKDYGPHDEYAILEGECYKFEDREYVYTLCPFERASQQGRSGGAETTLGRWDQWLHEDGGERKYTKQKYAHGASCWNGPQRSAIVHLKCALETRITAVSEPNRCEYFFDFETPAACDEEAFQAEEQRFKDEL